MLLGDPFVSMLLNRHPNSKIHIRLTYPVVSHYFILVYPFISLAATGGLEQGPVLAQAPGAGGGSTWHIWGRGNVVLLTPHL
jgi:hypothetical protein